MALETRIMEVSDMEGLATAAAIGVTTRFITVGVTPIMDTDTVDTQAMVIQADPHAYQTDRFQETDSIHVLEVLM